MTARADWLLVFVYPEVSTGLTCEDLVDMMEEKGATFIRICKPAKEMPGLPMVSVEGWRIEPGNDKGLTPFEDGYFPPDMP